jgi:tetratricopeptide (TPR) repeat protein
LAQRKHPHSIRKAHGYLCIALPCHLYHSEGNNFFKAKSYAEAIAKYSEAIELDSNDVTFFSNRSACYAALSDWEHAAADGRQCVIVDKSFVKGYFRAALALQSSGNLDAALDYVKRGLGIESSNADLKRMSREIEDQQRGKKVEALIAQAEQQIAANDITSAYKTLDAALRLEPTHAKLNQLQDRVRPQYERAEKARVAALDPKEKIKEEGDSHFKAARFEEAIKSYSRCLDQIPDKVGLNRLVFPRHLTHANECV